jgi:CheY-like chemotaxis protein
MTSPDLLIADDEAAFAEFVGTVAAGLGYTVRTAIDGATFKARYGERVPDVAVLDVLMPDADGLELTRWLVAVGYTGRLIVVSGYDRRYLRAAQAFGAVSGKIDMRILGKPVKLADLRNALARSPA